VEVVPTDLVAYAADGTDEGTVGTGADFATEIVDVNINNVGDSNRRSSPCLS